MFIDTVLVKEIMAQPDNRIAEIKKYMKCRLNRPIKLYELFIIFFLLI